MTQSYSDTQRMALRSQVKLASEIVAPYWPMRTFIHHNPLHELESHSFHEAVQRGQQLLGGRGYLPNEHYRLYYRQGRIRPEHVDAVLRPLAQDVSVRIGDQQVSQLDVLLAHLLHGIISPAEESLETLCPSEMYCGYWWTVCTIRSGRRASKSRAKKLSERTSPRWAKN